MGHYYAEMHIQEVQEKPPLGCKPRSVAGSLRIIELSEAIMRRSKKGILGSGSYKLTREWAAEIVDICDAAIKREAANEQG